MKRLTSILLVATAIVAAVVATGRDTRSVRLKRIPPPAQSTAFNAAHSVALFVGIRSFEHDDTLEDVPYAVDDAVDLAYVFALDPRVALVRPDRVALALSDENPRKEISKRRLAELKSKGATVTPASVSHILKLLARQAGTVGADGIFIVSFATHGFSEDGDQYLLGSNSLFREQSTAVPAPRVFDLVASSNATRSLILIDTCRERVRRRRSPAPEGHSAAPLIQRMGLTAGQVVLYAAAAGKWAYDDDRRQNGVFTGAVIDALQCRAGRDRSGIVTIHELAEAVERTVLAWIRINLDPSVRYATQVSIDGAARTMPLATCARPAPADPPPVADNGTAVPASTTVGKRTPLRPLLEQCRADGATLLTLFQSREPNEFVTTYLRWRDGCVAVLRDLDARLPRTPPPSTETVRFLSAANSWCATQCPDGLSAGNCALFQETPRAERCYWDLHNAVKQVDDVLVRNPAALQNRELR